MRPVEALQRAVEHAMFDSMKRKPGEIVGRMSEEVREALKRLTSKDALNLRVWWK